MTETDKYRKLIRAIEDWILGQDTYGTIAGYLGVTPSFLKDLLFRNGLSDAAGRPELPIGTQDVLNIVFLSFSLRLAKWVRG